MIQLFLAAAPPKQLALVSSDLGFVVVVVVLAVVSARLLGIGVSWPRCIFAAFVGVVAGSAVYYGPAVESAATPEFGPTFVIPALLVTMLVLAIVELAYRPGSLTVVPAGFARIPRPIKTIKAWAGRTGRYFQVLWIAARNGLNPYLRGRVKLDAASEGTSQVAFRLRRTFEECGGVFVKLGQVLSTRPDLLPESFIEELSMLQDSAPPVPYAEIESLLESGLGGKPADLFAEFDQAAIAAASIAQVHRARLKSGEQVVVKVRRPRVAALVQRDLEIIQRMARRFGSRTSWAGRESIVQLADGFAAAIREEIDFRIEAGNIKLVAGAGSPEGVRVPQVFAEFSNATGLVMEWLDGVKLCEGSRLLCELQIDRDEVARRLLRCALRQILVDGIYHADPHPGNVLVLRDGTAALIDFGSVGRLSTAQRSALGRGLLGIHRRDTALMRDALSELADIRDPQKQELLERALGELLAQRLSPGMQVGPELFGDLLRLLVHFELAVPAHVAAVFRCLVTLDGTLRLLTPTFPVIDEAGKAAAEIIRDDFGPATHERALRNEVLTQLPILRRLPRRVEQLVTTIEDGRLAVRVSLYGDAADRRFLGALVGRATLAFIAASLGVTAVMLESVPNGPPFVSGVTMFHALGYFGLLSSAVLTMRVIVAIARDRAA